MEIIDLSLIVLGGVGGGLLVLAMWQWLKLQKISNMHLAEKQVSLSREQRRGLKLSAGYIYDGVWIFLQRKILILFVLSLFGTLLVGGFMGRYTAIFFFCGAFIAVCASLISIQVSVGSHRLIVLQALYGLNHSLNRSLRTASIAGLGVAGVVMCLLCAVLSVGYYQDLSRTEMFAGVTCLILGSVIITFFMRLGGGIFTKGADVGLAYIAQTSQHPANDSLALGYSGQSYRRVDIATLVDQVGDNIGDIPGIATDFVDTVVIAVMSCWLLVLAPIEYNGLGETVALSQYHGYALLCLVLTVLSSLPGFLIMHLGIGRSILTSFYRGFGVTVICASLLTTAASYSLFEAGEAANLAFCAVIGHVLAATLCMLAHVVTGQKNLRQVLQAAHRGTASATLQGLVSALQACVLFGGLFLTSTSIGYFLGGLFGLLISLITLSGYLALIITFGVFAPVADNAHGAAEMNKLPESVQIITRQLDQAGHVAKGVTKLFTTGVTFLSGISLMLLLLLYLPLEIMVNWSEVLSLLPYLIFGIFLGCCVPFLFCGLTLQIVGKAALYLMDNVTRLKQEGPKNYRHAFQQAIANLSLFSLQSMIKPVILVFCVPFTGYSLLFLSFGRLEAFMCLFGGMLGVLPVAFFLSIVFNTSGLLWNNAKYMASTSIGSRDEIAKLSEALKISDMIGDPFKDSLGPSLNPMIKLSGVFGIFLLSFLMVFQV